MKRIPSPRISSLVPIGVALATLAVVWPAFAHAIDVWSTTEEFSYGYLIPPVALGVVWLRRQELLHNIGRGSNVGLFIVAVSLLTMLSAERTGIHALAGI